VQADPMKVEPACLKPKGDILLLTSALKFNLRRFIAVLWAWSKVTRELKAGAYTRPLFGST